MSNNEVLVRKGHHDRPDLVGEHKWGDLGQLIFLGLFLAVWITDSFFLHYTDFLSKNVLMYIRLPLSLVVLAVSLYMAKSGLNIIFGEKREKPEVIRKGVFNLVRHPIYLAAILLYLGLIIFTLSLAAVALWLIIIIFYHMIAKYEEKLLLERFGEDYRDYMADVPMWFPGL